MMVTQMTSDSISNDETYRPEGISKSGVVTYMRNGKTPIRSSHLFWTGGTSLQLQSI
jgi:hypothetical protein